MEINDKEFFKSEIRKKIAKYIRQFPVYFYGNIMINLIMIALIGLAIFFMALDMRMGENSFLSEGLGWIMVFSFVILRVTIKGFLKNIKILKNIQAGDYEFGIADHEIDNAVEFLEDLPMKNEDLDRLKIALSFGKLIDVFEAVGIIKRDKEMCDLDIIFKYRTEEVYEMENAGALYSMRSK